MRDYDSLFTHTADAMCELRSDGTVLRVNRAFRTLLGIEAPLSLLVCFDQEGAQAIASALCRLDGEKPTCSVDAHVPDSSKWISWQLTRLDENTIVAAGRDVTDEHETARTLAEKSSFLQSIIDAEPECVKLVSSTGQLLDMNAAGLRMIGAQRREDVVGQVVYPLIAPEDRERFIAFNERVCRGERGELAFDIIALDGERHSMETVAVPLPSQPDGELLLLAITRDVTDRRALETQLRQAQKMEAVSQLAGGIAHDFNNLLTAIIGPAELALADVEPGTQLAADLEQIKTTGERAGRLTQQLLTFARRHTLKLEPLAPAQLVRDTEEMLSRLLGEAYCLELEISEDPLTVRADRGQLEQVLFNLVVNARDAVEEGGRIHVRVAQQQLTPAQAEQLRCEPGNYAAICVRDDGDGIPAETLPHIFDPFYTTKPIGAGTGLGLSTCYGIIAQLGGAISVETAQGEGTTFTVLIPVTETPSAAGEKVIPSVPGNQKLIVVVEDEDIVRQAVSRMLEALGFRVAAFSDASEAIVQLEQLPHVALLITDMTMPGMSGRELAARVRQRDPEARVLFMTGYLPGSSQSTSSDETDGAQVLQKPFTSRALSQAVATALVGPDAVQA